MLLVSAYSLIPIQVNPLPHLLTCTPFLLSFLSSVSNQSKKIPFHYDAHHINLSVVVLLALAASAAACPSSDPTKPQPDSIVG